MGVSCGADGGREDGGGEGRGGERLTELEWVEAEGLFHEGVELQHLLECLERHYAVVAREDGGDLFAQLGCELGHGGQVE